MPTIVQTTIAVHELTHALQDQYFDLKKLTEQADMSTDLSLARSALIEGDATAVMLDYNKRLLGRPGIAEDASVEGMMIQNILGMGLVGGMEQIPESLKLVLLFPYTSGLRFAHSLLQQGGYKKINEAFESPPRSTEEILHPEHHFHKAANFTVIPASEVLAALPNSGKGFSVTFSDSLGEFVISLVLANNLDRSIAVAAANGWGGDTVLRAVNSEINQRVIAWKTRWDTQEDATEFYEAMKASLEKRYSVAFKEGAITTADKRISLSHSPSEVLFMERAHLGN